MVCGAPVRRSTEVTSRLPSPGVLGGGRGGGGILCHAADDDGGGGATIASPPVNGRRRRHTRPRTRAAAVDPGEEIIVRVLMIAPPGAGKGTQGALIATHFAVPHIAT